MDLFTGLMISILISASIIAVLLLIRNEWVFKKRMELNRFEDGVHLIHLYEDYMTMFFKFWIFDIEKFKRK